MMAKRNQNNSLPLIGGGARNLPALVMVLGTLTCFGLALMTSWPLSPSYVNEGGITKLRLAIAALVAGQVLAFGFVCFFVFDILVRIKQIAEQLPNSKENDS